MTTDSQLAQSLRRVLQGVEFSGRALLPRSNDELLQSIVETAARIFDAPAASILLVNEREQVLEFRVASGPVGTGVIGMKFPLDHGIAGYAVMTGQPLVIADVEEDARFARDTAEKTGYVPHSIMAMPLVMDERVIGVLEVLDRGGEPSAGMEDLELLGVFARQAAIAIHASQQLEALAETLLREAVSAEPGTSDVAHAEMTRLAALYNDLSALGIAERQACLDVLEAFARYAGAKNARLAS
jgi:GAF domain-containing protein